MQQTPNQLKANNAQIAEKILKDSSIHFTKCEVENLLRIFAKCTGNDSDRMDRIKFRDILHNTFGMTNDTLMDRIFKTFDKDNDSLVSKEEWVRGMSIYLRGTLEEQAKFCFDVYSMSAVNSTESAISKEDIFSLLKTCLVKQPLEEDPDEGVKDLTDMMLKKMDFDKDNKLSFDDFKRAIFEENLLLEAFGPCLPDVKVKCVFLNTIRDPRDKRHSDGQMFMH